ncbi:hypothetical protein IFM89_013322 [Coptis chinensis]|uniref:Uncharacterized protein n=1 Tax=Coptis chinensis TaxID=261450 RepID=A0A835HCW3_9MAGN|nr:hypothetical protein IFM89_013322 [Coptis chinensis]
MTLLLSPRAGQMRLKKKLAIKSFLKKAIPNHSCSCKKQIYPPPGPDPDLGLEVGQNKVALTISINKFHLFTMSYIFWNIRAVANDKSQNMLSKLINRWDLDIVGITEPKIHPNDIPINFLHSLGMSNAFYSNPRPEPNRFSNL